MSRHLCVLPIIQASLKSKSGAALAYKNTHFLRLARPSRASLQPHSTVSKCTKTNANVGAPPLDWYTPTRRARPPFNTTTCEQPAGYADSGGLRGTPQTLLGLALCLPFSDYGHSPLDGLAALFALCSRRLLPPLLGRRRPGTQFNGGDEWGLANKAAPTSPGLGLDRVSDGHEHQGRRASRYVILRLFSLTREFSSGMPFTPLASSSAQLTD